MVKIPYFTTIAFRVRVIPNIILREINVIDLSYRCFRPPDRLIELVRLFFMIISGRTCQRMLLNPKGKSGEGGWAV